MKIFKLLSLILFISFGYANADTAIVCNSCDSEIAALNHASMTLEPLGLFHGKISVGNIQKSKYYAFNVYYQSKEDEFGNDPVQKLVIKSIRVDTLTTEKFNNLAKTELYQLAKSNVKVTLDSGFESAWDIARTPADREQLDQWFHDNYSIQYWTNAVISSYGSTIIGALSGLEIKFEFSDGSTLIMVAPKLTSTSLKYSYMPNSAQDKSSNTIPDSGTGIDGNYVFDSSESINDFIGRAVSYGINIYVSSSHGGTSCPSCNVTFKMLNNSN
jgi:hypothetical protein